MVFVIFLQIAMRFLMLNLKIFLFFLLIPFIGYADQEKRFSLYYVKLGGAHSADSSSGFLPEFGLGVRFQQDKYGFDLSTNLGSAIFVNDLSLKGVFLFYPWPKSQYQLYFGAGPSVGYHLVSVPMGQPFGGSTTKCQQLFLEGFLGCEFRRTHRCKTFFQMELSQPVVVLSGHKHYSKPGVALTGGIGF